MMNEDRLNEIVEKVTRRVLNEKFGTQSLVEMARINKEEPGNGTFPYDGWELRIWSNDHNPPHFHIIKDGWNVVFSIETGDLIKIEGEGKQKKILNYMCHNVKHWLSSPCSAFPQATNQQNAMQTWKQLHD